MEYLEFEANVEQIKHSLVTFPFKQYKWCHLIKIRAYYEELLC